MPDLIAQGPEPTDRWRKSFPPSSPSDAPIPLGRTVDLFNVPWDKRVSRTHAMLMWDGRLLHVSRHIDARNPVFFRGHQDDQFHLQIGEHFVIGATTFTLASQLIEVTGDTNRYDQLVEESFTTKQLAEVHYQDAQRRVDALARLPSVLSSSANDEELVVRVVNVLMNGIRHATFVAIVRAKQTRESAHPTDDIQILNWDSRDLNRRGFSPSRSLIHRALSSGESVLHMWNSLPDIESGADSNAAHTAMANVDWAFCVPIAGESSEGWAIYVAGTLDQLSESNNHSDMTPDDNLVIKEELKFTELTATTISAIRQSRLLQQRQDMLRPFFAPVVRNAILRRGDDRDLKPRETDVSVLFCDLRGFSQRSEEMEGDLLELLQRVSDALGITTRHIMLRDGVVGDFHGDAAMGFWGWPIESTDYIAKAVDAALAIHREFKDNAAKAGHALAGFQAGLGIASGRAVAGQIGTTDQVKITVFGPVVNLASRLEGMTKQLNASILIDETTAAAINASASSSARVRRVAKVLPSGMSKPLVVSELLPPVDQHPLSDSGIQAYESALDAFQKGDWETAFSLLHNVPSTDRVKDYLTVYIAQHGRRAPVNWNGVITLQSK